MAIKFNKFERVAGMFILVALVGSLLAAVSVAVKQGWFETKVWYHTFFQNADGVHPGTVVQIAGLRAGSVEDVELQNDNRIKVLFYVHGKFQNRVRSDSKAHLIRPFIIGDRVLELSVGGETEQLLAEHSLLKSEETIDLMTILSGKAMGNYFSKISVLLENMHEILEAFSSKDRTRSVVRIFDRLDPLLGNLNHMSTEVIKLSKQITHQDNVKKVLSNAVVLTEELNHVLPELNRKNPQLASDLALVTKNLSQMTTDLKVIGPAFSAIGNDMPQAAKRAVEALNEATILIKAMQKSFFVRNSVDEVKTEEAKEARRTPSSVQKPSSNPVNACEDVK